MPSEDEFKDVEGFRDIPPPGDEYAPKPEVKVAKYNVWLPIRPAAMNNFLLSYWGFMPDPVFKYWSRIITPLDWRKYTLPDADRKVLEARGEFTGDYYSVDAVKAIMAITHALSSALTSHRAFRYAPGLAYSIGLARAAAISDLLGVNRRHAELDRMRSTAPFKTIASYMLSLFVACAAAYCFSCVRRGVVAEGFLVLGRLPPAPLLRRAAFTNLVVVSNPVLLAEVETPFVYIVDLDEKKFEVKRFSGAEEAVQWLLAHGYPSTTLHSEATFA